MKTTFECNESMIITIPIGNLKDAGLEEVMPKSFHCVFKDSYKIFVVKGKPKPLGAAQAIAGVFLCTLGLVLTEKISRVYTLPSVLFVVSGMLSYAAGKTPHMPIAKLSFSLNIISYFWSVVALTLSVINLQTLPGYEQDSATVLKGIDEVAMSLLLVENFVALFLSYWLSRAICRQHFNSLPTILLKQGDGV